MPAYKDSKTGTWFVKFYCKDWTGENKQIKKRGFATKREALDYERNYKIRQENNLDMTFGEFWKLYTEDVKNYVKLNTWLTKEHIVDTKILPYFKNLKMNEITPGDVRKWQNEMVAFRYENGKCYSQTYKKTMHNILSAIFNHACRFYNLKSNPARQAGNMGREEKKEMLFWTTEEYKKFSEAVIDKPVSFYAFEMLYWTGMRLGELLALTMEDFDFEKNTVRINKSYTLEKRTNLELNADTIEASNADSTYDWIRSLIALGSATVFEAEDEDTYIGVNIQNAAALDDTSVWDEEKTIAENSVATEEDIKEAVGEDAQITEFQNNVEEITFLGEKHYAAQYTFKNYDVPFYGVTVYLVNEQDPRYLLAIDILGSDLNAVDQADQFFSVYTE